MSELILKVGDENVIFQNLSTDLVEIKAQKKDGLITFATALDKTHDIISSNLTGKKSEYVALVLWLPRKLVEAQPKEKI